uniref:Uncharacterized protein n=1 Tax=Magallana gigas TaxID=29159 RepID=A0A8W8P2Q5_MAGGI
MIWDLAKTATMAAATALTDLPTDDSEIPRLSTIRRRWAPVATKHTYDRNRYFQPPPLESVPIPVSVGWQVSGYQQLHKEHKVFLPKITKEQIDQYFDYHMAGDKQFTKDIKAVSKGNAMFQGNRWQECSITVKDNAYSSQGLSGQQ